MGLVLTVQEAAWRSHIARVATSLLGLIPVVKGNGYGIGRRYLADVAATTMVPPASDADPVASSIAVGTVHEATDVPATHTTMVLTPEMGPLPDGLRPTTVLTVGSVEHVSHLARLGWTGPVILKLASSVRRFGCDPDNLADVHALATRAGLDTVAYALHPPLAGDDHQHVADITAWIPRLDHHLPVLVSHLSAEAYQRLRGDHPDRRFAIRNGTTLWLGDKSMFHLGAAVTQVRTIRAGESAGYRMQPSPVDGYLVMVSAGSAHGVVPLAGDLSPFHYARRRLALLEPPHMHTSMVLVPAGQACPSPGDMVDVQRPLTQVAVDSVDWVP